MIIDTVKSHDWRSMRSAEQRIQDVIKELENLAEEEENNKKKQKLIDQHEYNKKTIEGEYTKKIALEKTRNEE